MIGNCGSYPQLFITTQRGGTCSLSSIEACIRLVFCLNSQDPQSYKTFILSLKSGALKDCFEYAKSQKTPSESTLMLLQDLKREFAHTLRKKNCGIFPFNENLLMDVETFLRASNNKTIQQKISDPVCFLAKTNLQSHLPQLVNLRETEIRQPSLPLLNFPKITTRNANNQAQNLLKGIWSTVDNNTSSQLFILHQIDHFAIKMSLDRSDWESAAAFEKIYQLLNKYCQYSVQKQEAISPRQATTMLTLYYSLWAMLPYYGSQLKENAFECPNLAQDLVRQLAPSKNLFYSIDNNVFFLMLSPYDQQRFNEVKKAFEIWECENPLRIFECPLAQDKIIPDKEDSEIGFYKSYCGLLSKKFKETFTYKLEDKVPKEIEQQAILALNNKYWNMSFPLFAKLRSAHGWIENFTQGREQEDRHSFYSQIGNTYMRAVLDSLVISQKPPSHPCYFQQSFGYFEKDLPNILKQALTFSSLRTKRWDYLAQFQSTCIEEALALDYQGGLSALGPEDNLFLRECGSLATDPTLAPHHLLTLYAQHASLLQQQTHRTLLLTQLFKTRPLGKNSLQETIDFDAIAIAEKLCTFAKTLEALAFQAESEINHQLFLYATYILSSAAQYYSPDTLPESLKLLLTHQLDRLDQCLLSLEGDQMDESTARLYHLHKLYALTKIGLNNTNLAEAFGHYFALCTFCSPKDQSNLLMELSAVATIQDHLKTLITQDKTFLRKMVVSISKATKFNDVIGDGTLLEDIQLDKGSATLTCRSAHGNQVAIHCTTGDIFYQGELLKRSGDFGKGYEAYKLLFGNKTYPVLSTGKTQYLYHPAGIFRKQGHEIAFLPQNHKDWVIYCPAKEMDKSIPLFLRSGYCHFYNPTTDQWTFVKGKDYKLFDTSFTWKVSEQKIYSHDKKTYYSPVSCLELEKIEYPNCIVKKFDHGHTYLELPRYNLTFLSEEGKLKWTMNQNYYLVTNTLPPKTLCIQKQSLLLQNNQGKQILLVPRFPIKAPKGFCKKGSIILPIDEEKNKNFNWGAPLLQERYSCFTLSAPSTLMPVSTEDTLTLAYYSLQDREFERFNVLLKTISPCDTLNGECFRILQWIFAYGENQSHCSPEVHVSILRAALLFFYMKQKNDALSVLSPEENSKITRSAQAYLTTRTHINHNLRLTQDEERYISQYIPDVFGHHLKSYENNFSPKVLRSAGFTINIPPQQADFSWVDLGPSKAKLPSLLNQMAHNLDYFFAVYQAIISNDFDLKRIETCLLVQKSLGVSHKYPNLALCCLEAKKRGLTLPPLPLINFWDEYYLQKDFLTPSDLDIAFQSFSKEGGVFNTQLNNKIKDISYTIAAPNIPTESAALNQAFFKPQKENNSPEYYPINLSAHIKTIRPIREIAGLAKKNCTPHLIQPQTIQVSVNSEKDVDHHCIQTEITKMNQEIQEGMKRLAEWHRMKEVGQFYGTQKTLIKTLKNQIRINQDKANACQKELLKRVNQSLNWTKIPLTTPQLKEIEGTWPKIPIEQLEQIALWGDKNPETFQRTAKKCPNLRQKKFQKEVWQNLAQFEEHAVTCMVLEQASAVCEKLLSKQTTNKEAHFVDLASALEINLKTLGEDHQLSYLQMLIFARRSRIIPRNDQLEDLQKLSNGPCILQKIMGGGKSSVIAALWAFRQARFTDQLPTLFAEGSLYRSLANNLKKGQYTAFGQEVFTIDCTQAELDLPHLRRILADLQEGQKKKWVLVMRAEMLQKLT